MPQIFYLQPTAHTQLMLWHLTEPESFFASATKGIRTIAHPHKRLQHVCGRYLLTQLIPGFPLEQIVAEYHNKPFVPDHPYHFSISHCDDYVAAIVSTAQRVGIDVETISPKVAAIRHKFLTATEETILANALFTYTELEKLTLVWSAKETLFKWLGESGVDFKEHLVLQAIQGMNEENLVKAQVRRSFTQCVEIKFRLSGAVMLTWLLN